MANLQGTAQIGFNHGAQDGAQDKGSTRDLGSAEEIAYGAEDEYRPNAEHLITGGIGAHHAEHHNHRQQNALGDLQGMPKYSTSSIRAVQMPMATKIT